MRAVVMTEPSLTAEHTEIRDIPIPEPGPGQLSIDVDYAGINFVDVLQRRGDPGYVPAWPHCPGAEVAGRVRQVGPDVTGFTPGQRVTGYPPAGGLAEVAMVGANLTVPVPDSVPLNLAAAVPALLTTALLLLTDAGHVAEGETVLTHSASGGIGSAVARLAPLLGARRLIGTVGRPDKIAAAREAGYDVAVARGPDLAAMVRDVAPSGVDVVLDPLGTTVLDTDLAVAAPGARIVLFGNAGGGAPDPLPPMGRLLGGNVSIGGFSISSLTRTAPHRVAAGMRRVLDLLDSGGFTFPFTEVALAEVPDVHQALAEGRGTGKYVARVATG